MILKAIEESRRQSNQEWFDQLKASLLELEKQAYSDSEDEEFLEDYPQISKSAPNYTHSDEERIDNLIRMNTKQYDSKINILLIGEHLSGKTSLITTFIHRKCENFPNSTYG